MRFTYLNYDAHPHAAWIVTMSNLNAEPEMRAWCAEQFGPSKGLDPRWFYDEGHCRFQFKYENDVLLFKLRWA